MKLGFYLGYAWRSLRRGGQRTILAILCIALGVLSLVAMQLLVSMLFDPLHRDPRAELGGDLMVSYPATVYLESDQRAELERLREEGLIADYTLVAYPRGNMMLKREGSGQIHFLQRTMGIDPARYPLVGAIPLREPAGGTLESVLQSPEDAIITRDLADEQGMRMGERFMILGTPGSPPVSLRVAGIASSVPDRMGDRVIYNMDMAERIAGRSQPETNAEIITIHDSEVRAALQASGWMVITPEVLLEARERVMSLFGFMLKGAGLMGLMVGGVGVANTMKVLLARRTLEIAALKTHGFQRHHLLALFAIETGMIGLAGGLLGTLLALALSSHLLVLVSRTGAVLLDYRLDPLVVLGGLATGVVTAIIFGLQSIVWASAVRPATLLRELPTGRSRRTRAAIVSLYLLLATLLSGVAVLIMGSALEGIGAIGLGVLLLGILSALLWLTLWGSLKVPLPPYPMLVLARRNLGRQKGRAVLALIALFAGLFAISFSAATMVTGQQRVQSQRGDERGLNLVVHGSPEEEAAIAAAMRDQGVESLYSRHEVPVTVVGVERARADVHEEASFSRLHVIDGRRAGDVERDLLMEGDAWSGEPGEALVPTHYQHDPWRLRQGDILTVRAHSGTLHHLHLAGFYHMPDAFHVAGEPFGIITSRDTTAAIGGDAGRVSVIGTLAVGSLATAARALGEQLPNSAVVSASDRNDFLTTTYRNLFVFVAAVAGLALVAGGALIANAAGLAMMERRRELGVLKAVGYTSSRVFQFLLAEYALLGLIAGIISTGAVYLMIAIVNQMEPDARLGLPLAVAALLVLAGMAIAASSAALVAWKPVHVRPLEVLRSE